MAREIHDAWGVGMLTAEGEGTGVLVFLSQMDRALYLSRGSALHDVLTDSRLKKIIELMKPLLRQQKYGEALVFALNQLETYIKQGSPDFWEQVAVFFDEYGMIMLMATAIFSIMYWQRLEVRKYAEVESQLAELDRQRALALQGQYQAKSCPICLEPFPDTAQCKIIKQSDSAEAPDLQESEALTQGDKHSSSEGNELRLGSDGLPVKLLICGHVFDETCWRQWVRNGQGEVHKCPICKADVSGRKSPADENENRNRSEVSTTFRGEGERSREMVAVSEEGSSQRQRAIRQYQSDRAFRLVQLNARYPQYVRPQQIRQWTEMTYDRSLARDPSFVQSNPARQVDSSSGVQSGGRTSSSGFGGGFSGGGRGGRW